MMLSSTPRVKKTPMGLLLVMLLLGASIPAAAQWVTQSVSLKPGWNALYLHLDASYQTLDQLVGGADDNPIVEVWMWLAAVSPSQILPFQTQPSTSSQWASWVRSGHGQAGLLTRLAPNAAYLVHSSAVTNFTWKIKGKVVAPTYSWTSTGLNFIGFPTPSNSPPSFRAFLAPAPALTGGLQLSSNGQRAPGIYQYQGGNLGANNPTKLISVAWSSTPVTRGQAYWIDAGSALQNNYFGPFQIVPAGGNGLVFGDSVSQASFTLKNVTSSNLTVSARLLRSESPPINQPAIVEAPSLVFRGALKTNLTYASLLMGVGGSQSWTLAPQGQPGSELTVVVGINRAQLTGNPGDLYAGMLEFSDSLNLLAVDVPLSAQVASFAGLWVGSASVTQVANYLKQYARDANGNPLIGNPTNGSYLVTNVMTGLGPVPGTAYFPMRLIVHSDGTNAFLLQHVFYGLGANSNRVVATSQNALDPGHLDTARRISSVNFPWSSTNTAWPLSGALAPGASLTSTVGVAFSDQAANPFLHTYHPDHDNLDATFSQQLLPGMESYDITRQITLTIANTGDDFASLTQAGQAFSGTYQEAVTLTGLNQSSRTFNASGAFALNRISPIATLTRP